MSDATFKKLLKEINKKPDLSKMQNALKEDPVYKKSGGKIYNCR